MASTYSQDNVGGVDTIVSSPISQIVRYSRDLVSLSDRQSVVRQSVDSQSNSQSNNQSVGWLQSSQGNGEERKLLISYNVANMPSSRSLQTSMTPVHQRLLPPQLRLL